MSCSSTFMFLIFCCVALSSVGWSKKIQVPAVHDPEVFTAKLGTQSILPERFQFNQVREKSVSKRDSSGPNAFRPCRQNRPEVQFNIIDQILFQGVPKRPNVFYNFQQIQYSQYLLDVYYQDLKIYIMFKNHRLAIVTMEDNDRINGTKMIAIEGIDKNTFLQVGYFIKMKSDLLFINGDYALKISDYSARVLQGYEPIKQFQTAIFIQDTHFAILRKSYGVYIYEYDGVRVQKQYQFNSTIISAGREANLEDMVYWGQKKTLFTLDKYWGIRAFAVQKNQTNLTLKETNLLSDVPYCSLMYMYQSTLYVYCGQIRILKLNQWPKVIQTVAPYPNVQVKEIYQFGPITTYVGRNSFAMIYYGRLVNFFEDKNLDKLLLFKSFFISADEEGLDIGRIKIIPPYITCSTNDDNQLGETSLIIKTTAQCSDQYFEKFNIDKKMLGDIESDDVCVYPVFKTIKLWKVGQINPVPYIIGAVLILITVVAAGVIFLLRKKKIQRYQEMIQQYSRQQVSQSAKYQNIVEELDGGLSDNIKQSIKLDSQNKIEGQKEQKNEEKDEKKQSNPTQVQLAETPSHDI